MRKQFIWAVAIVHSVIGIYYYWFSGPIWPLLVTVPLTIIGVYDILQKRSTIKRNYPILGHFRYMLESIRPEIQQYFVERFDDGRPFSREQRSVVYQRAKGQLDTLAFGTQHDLDKAGAEWLEHSMSIPHDLELESRVTVGNKKCSRPYSCSIFNISAMSYGSLSKNAVEALNLGAKLGEFSHNTGEGSISPYHLKHEGDLVWQIGTGYFGCRNPDGTFNADMFKERSNFETVKMIELKISQGAKPGHGGILPASKVNEEVAKIRAVEVGKTVASPPSHSAFNTPIEMMKFIEKLRELSGGKPVGFKLCVGKKDEFFSLCKAMIELDIYPDFITVDGSEGGTGASPLEFTNYLGTPTNDALNFVHNTLIGAGIREHIKLIVSGKIINAFDLIQKFSLGADICNSARGMMFAIGCIQALKCNSNECPAGVATQDPYLYDRLDVQDKAERVARYHKTTLKELNHLAAAAGVESLRDIKKRHIKRKIGPGQVMNYEELFPKVKPNSLIDGSYTGRWKAIWDESTSARF